MCRKDSRVTGEIGPDYRRLMDLIRSRIASGEYPTGSQIPSTSQWEKDGWSRDVTREAIKRLQADEILQGQPGKGVFVKATPEQVVRERVDINTLREEVAALRKQVGDLAGRDSGSALAEVLSAIGQIEVNLIDLYGKLGFNYPQGAPHDDTKATARRGRAR